jgi:hypothetical protein
MNSKKRVFHLQMTFVSLLVLAVNLRGQDNPQPLKEAAGISSAPVEVEIFNVRVEGQRMDSDILHEEDYVRFQYTIENRDYFRHKHRAEQKRQAQFDRVWISKPEPEQRSMRVSEIPLPPIPPCGLKIGQKLIDWALTPAIRIHRVTRGANGRPERGEGWSMEDLPHQPVLKISDFLYSPTVLEKDSLIVHGSFDRSLIGKLGDGEYEFEVSLDTRAVTNLNVAERGVITGKFIFRIKAATTDAEKWYLEKRVLSEASYRGDWETVFQKTDSALWKHQDTKGYPWEIWAFRANAFMETGKDEEALAIYEEIQRQCGRNFFQPWVPVQELIADLRRKIRKKNRGSE